MVISVGIDVSKDKHDCFIVNSEGEVLTDVFTIQNTRDGFNFLLQKIQDCTTPQDKIKVGLEATGHYSYNLLGFLLDNGLPTYVLNPLRTNLYRKSLSLRKTKTDRVDARTIATMLLSDAGLKPYTDTAYHNEELKSLTRYRFDKVKERAKLKSSVSRLVCILFPELEKLVPSLHTASVYTLLEEFSGAKQIAAAHLTRLKTLLETASKGHYKRDMIAIGNLLKSSPDFPPLSTVHEGFPSHGAPSPSTFLFHTHDLERLDTHQSGFFTIVVQFGFLLRGQVQFFQQGLNGVLLRCVQQPVNINSDEQKVFIPVCPALRSMDNVMTMDVTYL